MTTRTRPGVGRRTAHDPGDPLVTSHCPFCGSGQVVGRSDGTIGCDFCGQNYIVRVQPAFPGMPQMPMGPGAPSDVGPDGGLMDPGMVGPDGMPMDDGSGMPPGEDPGADPMAGPPEGEEDEEGGPPPDGEEEDGPPPPKGKSKKASRRYLGMEGQALTEDQLVRHVAVRASGADPRVMAALRRTAAARSEQDKAARGHYQRGWKASERAGMSSDPDYSPLSRADSNNEPGAWYDGYHDHAADRPKYHALECPASDHDQPGCSIYGTYASRRPFNRTAHEGAQVRDLESLRSHMASVHDFDAAGILPRKVLLHVHEQEHAAEGGWHGSADASRSPGRLAARGPVMGAWNDRVLPGDSITQAEQVGALNHMREHMRGLGFPVRDTDEHGYPEDAPVFHLDTGHSVNVGLSRKDQTWVAYIHHPQDKMPDKRMVALHLGLNAAHVPHLLTRELGSQPVAGEMMGQWRRAGQNSQPEKPPGGWRHQDGTRQQPGVVHFTARGAQLPHEDEDDDY